MFTFSPSTCSPTRLPPPFFEKKLRPSSAVPRVRRKEQEHEQVGHRRWLEHDGVLARLDRRGVLGQRRLFDSGRGELLRLEEAQLVERLRRPPRSGTVWRPRREVVVGRRETVEPEETFRVADRLDLRRRLDVSGRHDALLLAQLDRWPHRLRAPLRPGARDILEIRLRRRVGLRLERRHRLRVLRRQTSDLFRVSHGALQTGVVELRRRHRPRALAEARRHRQVVSRRGPRCGCRVPGEPEIAAIAAVQRHRRFFSFAERQRPIDERLCLFLRPNHVQRPVLRMLTRPKRAIGQPWLTELLWPGWPLPSLNAPPSSYVDRPPSMSHDFQNSGVFDW